MSSLVRRYYAISLLDNLNFTLPIWVLFGADYLGLSYVQTILVMAMPGMAVGGWLNVPAGAWADRYGRRSAYVLGSVFTVIGYLPFLFTKEFAWLLLALPFVGMGRALRDGSIEAIVSVTSDKAYPDEYRRLTSRANSLLYAGRVLGSPAGGLLYAWDPRAPLAGVLIALAASAFLAIGMEEVHRRPSHALDRQHIRNTVRSFNHKPEIWALLSLVFGVFLVGDFIWTAYQPAFVDFGLNTAWIGLVFTAISVASLLGAEAYRRWGENASPRFICVCMPAASALTCAGLMLIDGAWALIAVIPMGVAFGLVLPIANAYVAARTGEFGRATALSFIGFVWSTASIIAFFAGAAILDVGTPSDVFLVGLCGAFVVGAAALAIGPRDRPSEVPEQASFSE